MSGSFSLSWSRFAWLAVVLIALPALSILMSRSGIFDPANAAVTLLCTSLLAFSAYRWAKMRAAFAAGQFTESDFRSDPRKILVGRPLHAILWFAFTLLLLFLPILLLATGHWPKA